MAETVAAVLWEIGGTLATDTAIFLLNNAVAVNTVAALTLAEFEKRRQTRKARDAYLALQQDRQQMVRTSVEPRRVILGRHRVGGHLTYVGSVGANKETLVLVLTLAGHECDAIERYWFNDTEVTLDGSGYVQEEPWAQTRLTSASASITLADGAGNVTVANPPVGTPKCQWYQNDSENTIDCTVGGSTIYVTGASGYSGLATVHYQYNETTRRARILPHLGTDSQTVDTELQSLLGADWDSNHRGRGICYVAVILTYDQDAFHSGLPVINAQVRGAKIYDTRTLSTAWSENPALLIRHYATSPLGANLPTARIDDAMVSAAANVCDTSVTYTIGGTPEVRALYTAGTVAATNTRPLDVIADLAQAMAGRVGWANDKLRMRAGAYTAPLMALTDDSFAGAVSVTPRVPRESLVNVVLATFLDEDNDYKTTDMPRVESSTYIADDGVELPLEVAFGAVTHVGQAQQLAGVMLREARQALTVTATFKYTAYAAELFDVVSLTCERYGWSTKAFEVLGRRWTLDGGIQLTLRETDSSIYAFGGTYDETEGTANSNLPLPWSVPQVTGLTVTSSVVTLGDGTPQTRVRASWTAVADRSVSSSGRYEVQFTPGTDSAPSGDWATWEELGNSTQATIPGLRSAYSYLFRVRARNGLGVRGNWSAAVAHVIAAPPLGVTTYRQASSPSDGRAGDLWIDSDDDNRLYRHDGTNWVDVRDAGIADALADAAAAQATADGKIESFWQASNPGPASEGDLWFDTDDGNRCYIYTGGSWQANADTRITSAVSAAATAQSTADGKVTTYVQSGTPSGAAIGDLWFKTTDNRLYRYNGSTWPLMSAVGDGDIDTGHLAPGAATYVAFEEASAVSVTEPDHVPDGEAWRDNVVEISYTPTIDCTAVLTYQGAGTYSTGATGDAVQMAHGVYIAGAFDGFAGSYFWGGYIGASASTPCVLTGTRAFDLTASTAYTFRVLANVFDTSDSATIDDIHLRLEAILR